MGKQAFNQLLLKTVFCCMACDGHIDQREIELIKSLDSNSNLFGDLDVQDEIDLFVQEINKLGHIFLRSYFQDLKSAHLTEDEELAVIEAAIDIIRSDDNLEYSEIKFFKIIRSKLNISNQKILALIPDVEDYLEQDIITESYIDRLKTEFFEDQSIPQFEKIEIQ